MPAVQVNAGTQVTATVTNQGPAPTGATVTLAVPAGLRPDGLTPSQGTCGPGKLVCELGVLGPGGTAQVTADVTGLATGDQPVGWAVTGVVLDVAPGANSARTVVPVVSAGAPPPPPPPPPAVTQPGVSVAALPNPTYVGDAGPTSGRTTLRVLRREIVAVPTIGKPGFVTSVRGTDFPPGVPLTLTWIPGITAAAVATLPGQVRRATADPAQGPDRPAHHHRDRSGLRPGHHAVPGGDRHDRPAGHGFASLVGRHR